MDEKYSGARLDMIRVGKDAISKKFKEQLGVDDA